MRVTRTVRDFQNALLTLLEEYSFEHLTVDQICQEASESAHSSLYAEMMHILSQIMLERRREKSNDSVIQLLQQTDDPEMLAYVLSGALIGTFYWWQEKNYDVSIEHVIEYSKRTMQSLSIGRQLEQKQ